MTEGERWYHGEIAHREEGEPRIRVVDPGQEYDGAVVEVFLGGSTEQVVADLPVGTRVWFRLKQGRPNLPIRATCVRTQNPALSGQKV